MELLGQRGLEWSKIYQIIFPGSPIPTSPGIFKSSSHAMTGGPSGEDSFNGILGSEVVERRPEGRHLTSLDPQKASLECPFVFLGCYERFDTTHQEDWHLHTLTHFCSRGSIKRTISPPKHNICCFCSATFHGSDGEVSWRSRLEHIASHHRIGETLSSANFDFALVNYMWQSGILDDSSYLNSMNIGQRRTSQNINIQEIPGLTQNAQSNISPNWDTEFSMLLRAKKSANKHISFFEMPGIVYTGSGQIDDDTTDTAQKAGGRSGPLSPHVRAEIAEKRISRTVCIFCRARKVAVCKSSSRLSSKN